MSLKIKDLFHNDISKELDTVVKIDDQRQNKQKIYDEVKDFVITREIKKKIGKFFESYSDQYADVNSDGVWISGFYGSGKSHLLKIVSYILENKEHINGTSGDLFVQKIKDIEHKDEIFQSSVEQSIVISSESILFNIATESESNKSGSILNLFYRMFNKHRGYDPIHLHVARFEEWLDEDGLLENFKDEYFKRRNRTWEDDRKNHAFPKQKKVIASIVASLYDGNVEEYIDVIDKHKESQFYTIDVFANKVLQYIKTKEKEENKKGFRLNFFVDEIGQYISQNVPMMLDIQSIAERLATRTKRKSWVFLTSQEDIKSQFGQLSQSQQNDLSKIQDRFSIRINLTSENVDEVIEKRLLRKKEEVKKDIFKNFKDHEGELKTICPDRPTGFNVSIPFENAEDYLHKYPFLPYQFNLFQKSISYLAESNAFHGISHSFGARSLLKHFQIVIQSIAEESMDSLVSFDQLYDAIRDKLKSQNVLSIDHFKENIKNEEELALRVLKTLFLVSYIPQFIATTEHIAYLLINSHHISLKEHEQQIQEAIDILVDEKLVSDYTQKNLKKQYKYLRNEEIEMEKDIDKIHIDQSTENQFWNHLFYKGIIKYDKIEYKKTKYSLPFIRQINGLQIGKRNIEDGIVANIVIPQTIQEYENYKNNPRHSLLQEEHVISFYISPTSNKRLLNDVKKHLKIKEYVKKNKIAFHKDKNKQVLINAQESKSEQLLLSIEEEAKELLAQADIYKGGTFKDHLTKNNAKDGAKHFKEVLEYILLEVYYKMKLLGNVFLNKTDQDIKNVFNPNQNKITGFEDDFENSEIGQEIILDIQRAEKENKRKSIKELFDRYSAIPYGFPENTIKYLIATLYGAGKIECKQDSNDIDKEQFFSLLNSKQDHTNILLKIYHEYDPYIINDLKNLYQHFFNESCRKIKGKDVSKDFLKQLNQLVDEDIRKLKKQEKNYPFLGAILEEIKGTLESVINKSKRYQREHDREYLLNAKHLQDIEEELKDPIGELTGIQNFINDKSVNAQKKIYLEIMDFIEKEKNNIKRLKNRPEEHLKVLEGLKSHQKPYEGNVIKKSKNVKEELEQCISDQRKNLKKEYTEKIQLFIHEIENHENFNSYIKYRKNSDIDELKYIKNNIQNDLSIAHIEVGFNDAEKKSKEVMENLKKWKTPENLKTTSEKMSFTSIDNEEKIESKSPSFSVEFEKNLLEKIPFPNNQYELTNKEDVLARYNEITKILLQKIKENIRIRK